MPDRYATGMKTRREVLGDAHVDRAEAAKTDFDAPFQDLITNAAWGTVWASDAISRSLWQRFGPEIDGLHGAVAHGFRRLLWRAAKQFDCGLLFHARIVNMFTAS